MKPLLVIAVMTCLAGVASGQRQASPEPLSETFDLTATTEGGPATLGTLSVPMVIQVDKYTEAANRKLITDALTYNGYPGFLQALLDAPPAGSLSVGPEKFVIRWARQQPGPSGRAISIVTDRPVFFVGGGNPNAKPKAGYDVAVVQLTVDSRGHGSGTMAAAARVKPGGPAGFQIDDYAETPMKITATVRPHQ
jgi:hypothetical protein